MKKKKNCAQTEVREHFSESPLILGYKPLQVELLAPKTADLNIVRLVSVTIELTLFFSYLFVFPFCLELPSLEQDSNARQFAITNVVQLA